jgi:hypothetical protein
MKISLVLFLSIKVEEREEIQESKVKSIDLMIKSTKWINATTESMIISLTIFNFNNLLLLNNHHYLDHPNSNPLLELIAIFNFCFKVYLLL